MSQVLDEIVEEALRELADERAQAIRWRSSGGPEVSSLAEANCSLWDDSGLADAMERGEVYDPAIDAQLWQLRVVLDRVNENMPVEELLANADLAIARDLAGDLLEALRSFGHGRADP